MLTNNLALRRYLQQLVSAQASRNRDLEQQLQQLRISGNGVPHTGDNSSNEDDTLMLHEEVGDDFLNMKGADNVFALGDCTSTAYAPTAQVASQQGAYLGRCFNQLAKRDVQAEQLKATLISPDDPSSK